MEPVIELADLGRRFGEREILRGLTLTVPRSATLTVLGANGSGKSTLVRLLAGLLRPTAGTVRVLGHALPDGAWAVRARMGVLTHDPLLYRELTARENLRYVARLFDLSPARVDAVLESVGLRERADDRVAELSRGMTQRVAIARAVLHEPILLILDEPTANLDPGAAAALAPLLGPAATRTRVLVSHDPRAALAEADLVLALAGGGRVAYAGPAEQVPGDLLDTLYAAPSTPPAPSAPSTTPAHP